MEYLATNFDVISLAELRKHWETTTPLRNRTVVVTFDGGYSDVLYAAKEVLERFEVPATVFVPSENLIERTRFWWDILEDLLIADAGVPEARSPDSLVIETREESYCWSLATQYDRFLAFHDLYRILSDATPARRREILAQVVRGLDGPREELDRHATLSPEELRKLEAGGLIAVGGHTHHCVKLSVLSETQQRQEIEYNKQILEEILGHPVESFAYPFGDEGSYIPATPRLLRGAGFRLSCRVSADTVGPTDADNLYELPRLRIGDWNPFTFHRYLSAFVD